MSTEKPKKRQSKSSESLPREQQLFELGYLTLLRELIGEPQLEELDPLRQQVGKIIIRP